MDIAIKPILWTYREILETEKNYVIGEHEVRIRLSQNRDLLSNAAKYSGNAEPVEMTCKLRDDKVTVSVADHGLGISSKDISKLFLPHYRVESGEPEKIEGFGIGLYLCAEIIQRHKGKIWVESELGKGSTFKFSLPIS
jgi:signal transduction histidine kinase